MSCANPIRTACLFWLLSGIAAAETRDPAAAQSLFDQSRDLMSAGRASEACPKLEESQRLDPGIGTQFRLAECYEQTGRVASAWAQFLEVASLATASQQTDRAELSQQRAAKLEARLSRLIVVVPDSHRVEGLDVRRDGMPVSSVMWGTAVPVDPGEHALVFTAPGRRGHTERVVLQEGRTIVLEVPLLVLATGEGNAPLSPEEPVTEKGENPPPDAKAEEGGNGLIWALAGVGVVGLGVGGVFSWMAYSANEDSKEQCRPEAQNLCSPEGKQRRDDALTHGNVATVAAIVGGAALLGAGVIWLFDDSNEKSGLSARARVSPLGAELSFGGSF